MALLLQMHHQQGAGVEVEVELRGLHLLNHLMLVQVKLEEKGHHLEGEEDEEEVFQGLLHTSMFRDDYVVGVPLYGLCCNLGM
ncbi:unnamed protein product [Urochloa humidicola]